jgi:tetratricopeptide (TPR) repeat protein
MKRVRSGKFVAAVLAGLVPWCVPARGGGLTIPPEAQQALTKIYEGDAGAAIPSARALEQAQPEHPLGFALEAEALWWNRYCVALELKYGIIEAWKRSKDPDDDAYLKLTDHVVQLAQAQLAKEDTAEMHVYAGMGWALKARLYGLRGENRNAAHAGVNARAEMLRALELDPQMADATAGLGIYNYYVATLPGIVKVIRFFMGIPGGDKEAGLRQMQSGMQEGVLLRVDVRFIYAKSVRMYDQKYEEALGIALPLVEQYPQNAIFNLLVGNLNAELGRNEKAAEYFHAAQKAMAAQTGCGGDSGCSGSGGCAARVRDLADAALNSLC